MQRGSPMAPSMAQQLNMLGVGGAGLGRMMPSVMGDPQSNVGLGSLGMGQSVSLLVQGLDNIMEEYNGC